MVTEIGILTPGIGTVIREFTKNKEKYICKVEITRPPELYFIFYTIGNSNGDQLFKASAKTRYKNIVNSSWYNEKLHKIILSPLEKLEQMEEIIEDNVKTCSNIKHNNYATVKEISIFSHSGFRSGPVNGHLYKNTKYPLSPDMPYQMNMTGWNQIGKYWDSKDSMCIFYGCNSAVEEENIQSFSQQISRLEQFNNVTVIGQPTYSYPSYLPDYRIVELENWVHIHMGNTYMVAGKKDSKLNHIRSLNIKYLSVASPVGYILSDLALEPAIGKFIHPQALPMNFYKNGKKISSSHQGVFNDHRKNKI